jgi:predicted small secreted protein
MSNSPRVIAPLLPARLVGATGVACGTVDGAGRDPSDSPRRVRDPM